MLSSALFFVPLTIAIGLTAYLWRLTHQLEALTEGKQLGLLYAGQASGTRLCIVIIWSVAVTPIAIWLLTTS